MMQNSDGNRKMDDVCYIDIADGIGNVIQSLPFVHEMKRKYSHVYGHNRPDYESATDLVAHLYDGLVPRGCVPKSSVWYPIPNLKSMGSYPEYKSWFKFHGFDEPDKFIFEPAYDEFDEEVDVVLWGGCKPQWRSKQWTEWTQLVDKLSILDHSIGLVGLEGEGADLTDIHGRNKIYDFRGKVSLLSTGGIIKKAKLFVGNEGGLSHYAAALGTKTFIIFGGTDPVKNCPPGIYDEQVRSISAQIACQPCQFRSALNNPAYGCDDLTCLKRISVFAVLTYINNYLKWKM
jgi:ADP-heptose:LPS heptosyltransferase